MSLSIQRTTDRILTLGDMGAVEVVSRAPFGGVPGWWDPTGAGLCIWAAYQPKGAASLAASYTDLSGNGNNAGVGVAPTWDAVNGWKFNGINQYLTTTFTAQADQSQSLIIQYTTLTNVGGRLAGLSQGPNRSFLLSGNNGGIDAAWANGAFQNQFPSQLTGNLCVAGNRGYRNGIDTGFAIGPWAFAVPQTLYIGAMNNVGVAAGFSAAYIQALAIYDCTLTAPQVLAVSNAMAAL